MMKRKRKDESLVVNRELLSIITPMGLSLKNNMLMIGEYLSKAYAVIKYPPEVEYGWLKRLTNIPSSIVAITFRPIDSATFIESLSKSIILLSGNAQSLKDPLQIKRAERAAIDAENMMVQIDSSLESVGMMSVVALPMARR